MLYLLTYADSLATGFRAWNNWKSMLIRELFFKLLRVLEQGKMATGQAQETLKSAGLEILHLIGSEMTAKEARSLLEGMPATYLLSVPPEKAVQHLKLPPTGRKPPSSAQKNRMKSSNCSSAVRTGRDSSPDSAGS